MVGWSVAEFDITRRGIDTLGCVAQVAAQQRIILRRGSYYYYDKDREEAIGRGIAGVTAWLRGNPDKAAEVRRRVLAGEVGAEPAAKEEATVATDEADDDWLM